MKPTLLVIVLSLLAAPLVSRAAEVNANLAVNQMAEVEFTTMVKRADPFNEVVVDAIFTDPQGKELRVPAFWAGDRKWKVRYTSGIPGEHKFRTEASDVKDAGLHNVTGAVSFKPYTGDNPLYKHGRLKVAKGGRFFEHADGTPFLWLGDTWWMGLTKRLSFPEEFNTLLADRKAKGFNVVQIVAGLYPDMPAFDPRGENETGVPWEKEYKAIRPAYFDAADKRIMRLVEEGFTPCIVSTWGYHLPFLGAERMKQHQRYVYARWGALPIVWCLAGEFNLPYYLAADFPRSAPQQAADWEAIIPYCRSINAFDRPITLHPWGPAPMSARARLKNPSLLDFDMLQTGHGQMEVLGMSVEDVRQSYAAKPVLPVVNGEPSYEMLFDTTPAEVARLIFWTSWFSGTGGYTYGANGIWQVNGREKRYGASPHGGDYGKIPWEDAMHLAGSTQVSLGKKLLEQYAWQKFEPKPQWAAWAETETERKPAAMGDWIWFPEGEPATAAPVATRYFRRSFEVPAGAKVTHAKLRMTADDKFTVSLDGKELGTRGSWKDFGEFDLADKLTPGKHVLAVRAENLASNVTQNPAGLVAGCIVELADGKAIELSTDSKWRASKDESKDWQTADFDDSGWSEAKLAAKFGAAPWGEVGASGSDPYAVPYAIGIDREVRLVYVLKPNAIVVRGLEPDVMYAAFHFDPVSGERHPIGDVQRGSDGSWKCESPKTSHDWVLILEAKK